MRSFFLLLIFATGMCFAADPAGEAKLRETLRATALQLRDAQNERDTLKAAAAENERRIQELTEQNQSFIKQIAADKEAADKKAGELGEQLQKKESEAAELGEALTKWKAAYEEAADLARKKEAARARLAAENIALQRRVDEQQAKNLEMHRLAQEILHRYETFGLGTALTAREPFVGTTRVKLQNLVQDYAEKLAAQRTKAQAGGTPAKQ
jgi:chromosome segregation ATPase